MTKRKVPNKPNRRREGYTFMITGLICGVLSVSDSYLPNDNGGINMWIGFFSLLFLLPLSIVLIGIGVSSLLRAERH